MGQKGKMFEEEKYSYWLNIGFMFMCLYDVWMKKSGMILGNRKDKLNFVNFCVIIVVERKIRG